MMADTGLWFQRGDGSTASPDPRTEWLARARATIRPLVTTACSDRAPDEATAEGDDLARPSTTR
jgi:hypothetical protein